jgi:hypothetical protein
MNRFKLWNSIIGWLTFAVAAIVYLSTIEPTASLWDCGEFIASSYKLEVGHPPGAPFFILLAKVFSLLTSEPSRVALYINAFSALASAFTILFLFWTITHFARKILLTGNPDSLSNLILTLGAGCIGALAYTFSDSFWFSAVEGEVYATSSLLTAVVFWAILKWEDAAGDAFANRWIILIAYLMGLSIGVHLLNLLAIPAISLVFYFKKFKPSVPGFILALLSSFAVLAFLQYGIIPGTVKLASVFELYFVNHLGYPYNSGVITYCILLFVILIIAFVYTRKKKKVVANTIILALAVILLGYSTYATIIIRANAGTPLNENEPKNVFSLLYYLNREQYGDRPLFKGQYYNAPVISSKNGEPYYSPVNHKYEITYWNTEYVYDQRFTTFFPRMYSSDASHIKVYKDWANIKGIPLTINQSGEQVVEYRPSFTDNLEFFIKYQVGYMYLRYFMWNFAGKQNNLDGNGGILNGNWISGIPWIDNLIYGPQEKLPVCLKENKGHNRYYFLPLLLGLAGMIYQCRKNKSGFSIVLFLFFMTGLAIVLYLNQTPLQPRERDYSYAGSFYAFAIWIGLGVPLLASILQRFLKEKLSVATAIMLSFLSVPLIMAKENWDDHDRSGRYLTRDIAFNYLNSCAPNSILFTNGDNDTFPLWYLQEVEGIRTDVRVVNLMLLNTDWYIGQMQQKYYNTDPVPMSLKGRKIRKGRREVIYLIEQVKDYLDLKRAVDFVASDTAINKYILSKNDTLDYLPVKNFVVPVDTAEVLKNGTISLEDIPKLEPTISFRINNSYIQKGEFMLLDILAQNNWKRPLYFTSPGPVGVFGFQRYLRLEGFAYRLTPIPSKNTEYLETGSVQSSLMYHNLMDVFQWKGMNDPHVLIDNHHLRTFAVVKLKINFARLAKQLALEGKHDSALKVINRYFELTPPGVIPPDVYSFKLAEACYLAGATERGDQVLNEYREKCIQELKFFNSLPKYLARLTEVDKIISRQSLDRLKKIADTYGRKLDTRY